jgi:hypothetical protein
MAEYSPIFCFIRNILTYVPHFNISELHRVNGSLSDGYQEISSGIQHHVVHWNVEQHYGPLDKTIIMEIME